MGALSLRLSGFIFGEPTGEMKPSEASFAPMLLHMSLVLVAGVYLPGPMVVWFQTVARLLG